MDPWGTKVQLTHQPWAQQTYFVMRSAGPDKQFNTADDVVAGLVARRNIVGQPSAGASAMDVNVEHDRGAFNGRAEVTGVVVDQQGGAVEGATVTLTATDGNQRLAHANSDGRFTLAGVPPGEYELRCPAGWRRFRGRSH